MSTRDRFLSSFSSITDTVRRELDAQLDSLQGQPPTQRRPSSQSGGSSHPYQSHRPSNSDAGLDRRPTLPTYARQPSSHGPAIPETVLEAPPGKAQQVYDAMPRSRLENPHTSEKERRKAAEEMRKNQEMLHRGPGGGGDARPSSRNSVAGPSSLRRLEREQAAGLKRTHSYASSSGKVLVDVFTLPQRSPTFMGGSAERGRGAVTGQVVVFANEGEKVGAVRLKIKAVSRTSTPRTYYPPTDPRSKGQGSSPSGPANLAGRSPRAEPVQTREQLLLQLEKTLWSKESSNREMVIRTGDGIAEDPTAWIAGRHTFDFKLDLPAKTKDGVELPPSFVFLADPKASASTVKQAQVTGALSTAKKWISETAEAGITGNLEWATVKWYIKVTIERPGMFKTNDRIFVPFIYLPPPPSKLPQAVLANRLKLTQQLKEDAMMSGSSLAEPASRWTTHYLDLYGTGGGGKGVQQNGAKPINGSKDNSSGGGIFSRIWKGSSGSSQVGLTPGQPQWSLSLPNDPAVWPLRSSIPFQLRVSQAGVTNGSSQVFPPSVALFLRVTLINGSKGLMSSRNAPASASETRLLSLARLYPEGPNLWRGVLELPPQASPCFDSVLIQTEYFVAVQSPVQQGRSPSSGGQIAWGERIILVCPLPTAVPTAKKPIASRAGRSRTSRQSEVDLNTATVRPSDRRKASSSIVTPPKRVEADPLPSKDQATPSSSKLSPFSKTEKSNGKGKQAATLVSAAMTPSHSASSSAVRPSASRRSSGTPPQVSSASPSPPRTPPPSSGQRRTSAPHTLVDSKAAGSMPSPAQRTSAYADGMPSSGSRPSSVSGRRRREVSGGSTHASQAAAAETSPFRDEKAGHNRGQSSSAAHPDHSPNHASSSSTVINGSNRHSYGPSRRVPPAPSGIAAMTPARPTGSSVAPSYSRDPSPARGGGNFSDHPASESRRPSAADTSTSDHTTASSSRRRGRYSDHPQSEEEDEEEDQRAADQAMLEGEYEEDVLGGMEMPPSYWEAVQESGMEER